MHYCSPSLRHHECVQLPRDYYSVRALSFTEVFGGRRVHLTASAVHGEAVFARRPWCPR